MSVVPLACVYNDAQRCGPHQHEISEDRCICDDGYAASEDGCVPCGRHERVANGECVCIDGYARSADGDPCKPIPEELGAACDTDSAPCTSTVYPLCHVTDGTAGYCTKTCNSSSDCDGGYRCHVEGSDGFCRRPPIGYGAKCETDKDCASGDATYCEILQRNICLVPCSKGHTDGCFEGEVCCDFVVFQPICVPSDACTANSGTEVQ